MNDHSDGSPTKDTIDVESNPNIRRLIVRAEPLASYFKYIFSRLSAPNIQQITLFMLWSGEGANWRGWNELDQVLGGVKFRGLREVVIVVDTRRDMAIIRQHLTDQFPSMYDRGILNVIVRKL
jgi:hypothetical protein